MDVAEEDTGWSATPLYPFISRVKGNTFTATRIGGKTVTLQATPFLDLTSVLKQLSTDIIYENNADG